DDHLGFRLLRNLLKPSAEGLNEAFGNGIFVRGVVDIDPGDRSIDEAYADSTARGLRLGSAPRCLGHAPVGVHETPARRRPAGLAGSLRTLTVKMSAILTSSRRRYSVDQRRRRSGPMKSIFRRRNVSSSPESALPK